MRSKSRPTGKTDVMNAILEAATALFAERGVAGVAVRDIAARANVNHGLVHRPTSPPEATRETSPRLDADRPGHCRHCLHP